MTGITNAEMNVQRRNLLFISDRQRWLLWPYLPLIRRQPGCEEELGVLYDLYQLHGLTGFSSTVFLTNLYLVPPTLKEVLALPKEVYDTVEEIYAAGWRVD